MIKALKCRRTFVALVAIGCLVYLGITKEHDVSMAIATIAAALAGANAYQALKKEEMDV